MSTVNIKDIAKLAGVGVATVSRALNNTGSVNSETKKKILQIAKDNNYIPNGNARNLKMTHSQTIALLVKVITNPFFFNMLKEIERQVNLRSYSLILQPVDEDADEIEVAKQLVLEKKVCGIIFIGGSYNHSEKKIMSLNVPCVLTTISSRKSPESDYFSSVYIDDVKEACLVTEYLISLGHKEIAFLAKNPFVPYTTGNYRLLGYQKALEKAGMEFKLRLVEDCEYTPTSGYSATKRLLTKNPSMTAIFAASDTIAIGSAKAVITAGLSIPDDISITGFDGIEMTEYYHPALDTLSQPDMDMASSSINILFDLINGTAKNQHIIYNGVLLKRGSSAPPRNI